MENKAKALRYNTDAFRRLIGDKMLKTGLTIHETKEFNSFCKSADIFFLCMSLDGDCIFTKEIFYGNQSRRTASITFSTDGFIYFEDYGDEETLESDRKLLEHTIQAISTFLQYGLEVK